MAPNNRNEHGFVLLTALFLVTVLLALILAVFTLQKGEIASVRAQVGSSDGFYAAEAGLNYRAELTRQVFVNYNLPAGTSPSTSTPCTGSDMGSGDYACMTHSFNNRTVKTYLVPSANNGQSITIRAGERYAGLLASEFEYRAYSVAASTTNAKEAMLELLFKSRLVPLFQFAVFYNKDLEILPGPNMTLSGPVFTNGDLYLYSNSGTLTIEGQTMAAGEIYRGRKDGTVSPSCNNQHVDIYDGTSDRTLISSCASRYQVQASDITPWSYTRHG